MYKIIVLTDTIFIKENVVLLRGRIVERKFMGFERMVDKNCWVNCCLIDNGGLSFQF